MGVKRRLLRNAQQAGIVPTPPKRPKALSKAAKRGKRVNIDPNQTVYPFALYVTPAVTDNGVKENLTALKFNPCRRVELAELAKYMFETDLATLNLPVPIKLMVAYDRLTDPRAILEAISSGKGVEGVPGIVEVRVPQGSELMNGADTVRVSRTTVTPAGDA